ncbi:HET-E1 [Symbiodinium sp. CCMP2592]|nr:HET-E1 [Symbiodinium sp. CCMP2592]
MALFPELEPHDLGQVVEPPCYQQKVPPEHYTGIHAVELCDGLDSPEPVKSPSSPQASLDGDKWMVDLVASMEPTRAEIIRGVPVHCALRGCGQAMRGRQLRGQHQLSRATTCIDEFWSHSWHTSAWMKYVTAWYLNCAAVAAAFGMGGALLGFVLRAVGVLPATLDGVFCDSQWSVLSGVIFFCASFMLWRVRRLVFLDMLCINQEDEGLKGEAMISMGAILKSSASMLVLWDPSWVQRFWCVFELASSIMVMALTISTGLLPCFLCLAHIGRTFCCSLDTLQQQLAKFRVKDAKCWCCTVNHVDETGEPLPCDRDVMLKCIRIWFGSSTDFESLVQGHVRTTLLRQLTSPAYLYQQVVVASSPVMWLFLDRVAYLLSIGDASIAVSVFFDALAWWLLAIPSIVVIGVAVAYKLRMKQARCVLDLVFSLAVLVVAACILAAFVVAYNFIDQQMNALSLQREIFAFLRSAIFAGTKLASASADGILRLWDPTSGTCGDLLEATEPRGFASCISWAPDGVRLATGYQDGEVVVWYPHAALATVSCSGHTNQVRCIAWSPQGKDCVASGSLDGTVRIWEPKKGKCLKTCQGDGGYVYCLLWHPEATSLAAGSTDGIARLFDPLTGTCIVRWEGHVGPISSLAWGPGATSLATGSHDGSAFIWGVDTGRQVAACSTPGRVYTIAWRNDSQRPRLATGSSDGSICIFDASLGVCSLSDCGWGIPGHSWSSFDVASYNRSLSK